MKDGDLRNQRMVLNRAPAFQFEPRRKQADLSHHNCPCKRWGSFSFDAGQTWFCADHKPEQRS